MSNCRLFGECIEVCSINKLCKVLMCSCFLFFFLGEKICSKRGKA